MQSFLDNLRARMSRFMYGRHGGDQLGLALVIVAFACSLAFTFTGFRWLSVLSTALLLMEVWRLFSRNLTARTKENEAYLAMAAKPRSWVRRHRSKWAGRKTKAYVRCPHCHAEFALPKGKGKLRATCPSCGRKSEHTV